MFVAILRADVIEMAPRFKLLVFILMPTFTPVVPTNVAVSVLLAAAPPSPGNAVFGNQFPTLYHAPPLVLVFHVASAAWLSSTIPTFRASSLIKNFEKRGSFLGFIFFKDLVI